MHGHASISGLCVTCACSVVQALWLALGVRPESVITVEIVARVYMYMVTCTEHAAPMLQRVRAQRRHRVCMEGKM
jgi:hypothetical protein